METKVHLIFHSFTFFLTGPRVRDRLVPAAPMDRPDFRLQTERWVAIGRFRLFFFFIDSMKNQTSPTENRIF